MPKAILKIISVDGLSGMPKKPIIPPVTIKGIIFGIIEINTIRHERNKSAINTPIQNIAKIKL